MWHHLSFSKHRPLLASLSFDDVKVGLHYFFYPTFIVLLCYAYDFWRNYHAFYTPSTDLFHIPATLFYNHKKSLFLIGHTLFFLHIPFIYRRIMIIKLKINTPSLPWHTTRSFAKLFFYFFLCPTFIFALLAVPYFALIHFFMPHTMVNILKISYFIIMIPALFYFFHARLYAVMPGHFSMPVLPTAKSKCFFHPHAFKIFAILFFPFIAMGALLTFSMTSAFFASHIILDHQHFQYLSLTLNDMIIIYVANIILPTASFAAWICYIVFSVNIFIHQKNCTLHQDTIE